MKTSRTRASFKNYAYISVSCLALSSCLGVFEKQPERYNTVLGEKRAPLKNPPSSRPVNAGNQARTPTGNPAGAPNAPLPQGGLTPYDQYPASSMPEQPTFQQDDKRVEAVPMTVPTSPAYDVQSEMSMAEGAVAADSTLEPSPLYYYEQQKAEGEVSSQPIENIPLSNNAAVMPDNLKANAAPYGVQQDIDSMYDASIMPQNTYNPAEGYAGQVAQPMNYNPSGEMPAPQAQQVAQNYIPVIENTPSPLQQFEPAPTAFPELGAIPPAPDYNENFDGLQSEASQFANQYSPDLAGNIPPARTMPNSDAPLEDQPAAAIEMSASPLVQYEQEQQRMQQQSYPSQPMLEPVYELPVVADVTPPPIAEVAPPVLETKQPRVTEFTPEPLMATMPPPPAPLETVERNMARRPEMQYEPVAPVVQTQAMPAPAMPAVTMPTPAQQEAPIIETPMMQAPPPPPLQPIAIPVALAPVPLPPEPAPMPYYEAVDVPPTVYPAPAYEQAQQPYAPPPPPVAAVDFSRQPLVMPAPPAPSYEPPIAQAPVQDYVTQSEYQLDEIAAAPPPARRQEVMQEPNLYEEELVQTYDPEKNTVSIPDAPEVATPSRVFTSAGPITLTPPPSIRARKGESIAQSKYNMLRRSHGAARATLRH